MNLGTTGIGVAKQFATFKTQENSLSPRAKELAALKKACESFEAIFAKRLLGEMRKGVQDSMGGKAPGAEIYKDMMDQAIAESMAKQGSLGISRMLYKQFEKQVAASSGEAPSTTSTDKDKA